MKYRIATLNDVPAIVRLLADDVLGQTREQSSDPLADAYVTAFLEIDAQPGNQIIVACDDTSRVRACLQLTFTPGLARAGVTRATLEGVRVDRSMRGTGLGAALIENAISIAKEENCGLVQLTTDKIRQDAHKFYRRLGFVPSHIGMKRDL